jgi:hypothetical protein
MLCGQWAGLMSLFQTVQTSLLNPSGLLALSVPFAALALNSPGAILDLGERTAIASP